MRTKTIPEGPDPLPSQLLNYNPTYRILICTECQYAIQPTGIVRHLKEIHQIKRARRRPFMEYVCQFSFATPEEVFQTSVLEFPVPGLPVLEGLRCEKDGCGHLCVSEKRMKSHWVADHGHCGKVGDWKTAEMQTFFRGNLLRYFTAPSKPELEKVNYVEAQCPKKGGYQTQSMGITSSLDKYWVKEFTEDIPSLKGLPIVNIYPSLNEKDSFLLEHYLTHTAPTLSSDRATLQLWQESVPFLARSHQFLFRGLLALSALHLAHNTPNGSPLYSEYCIAATTHQDAAMPDFRSAIAAVTRETSHAVLAFSHLLVLYSFASESQDERLFIVSPTPDLTPVWLQFLRTGCELLCNVWHDLESGPVKALVDAWDIPDFEDDARKTPLVEDLLSVIPPTKTENSWTQGETDIYTDTAILLGRAFTNGAHGIIFTTWDALRIWPMCISSEYMKMVGDRHPGALILLAHYCVLLKKVEGNWYFDGRATRLLKSVIECLDQRWMKDIRWPMEQIGVTATMQEYAMDCR